MCSMRPRSMYGPRGCSCDNFTSIHLETAANGDSHDDEEAFFRISIPSSKVGQSKSSGCLSTFGGILILSTHFRYDSSTAVGDNTGTTYLSGAYCNPLQLPLILADLVSMMSLIRLGCPSVSLWWLLSLFSLPWLSMALLLA